MKKLTGYHRMCCEAACMKSLSHRMKDVAPPIITHPAITSQRLAALRFPHWAHPPQHHLSLPFFVTNEQDIGLLPTKCFCFFNHICFNNSLVALFVQLSFTFSSLGWSNYSYIFHIPTTHPHTTYRILLIRSPPKESIIVISALPTCSPYSTLIHLHQRTSYQHARPPRTQTRSQPRRPNHNRNGKVSTPTYAHLPITDQPNSAQHTPQPARLLHHASTHLRLHSALQHQIHLEEKSIVKLRKETALV